MVDVERKEELKKREEEERGLSGHTEVNHFPEGEASSESCSAQHCARLPLALHFLLLKFIGCLGWWTKEEGRKEGGEKEKGEKRDRRREEEGGVLTSHL